MRKIFLLLLVHLWVAASYAQQPFDVYISNNGSDIYNGNSAAQPKKTLNSIAAAQPAGSLVKNIKIGLKAGDVFNETFNPSCTVHAGSYDWQAKKSFAILNGTAIADTGWQHLPGTNNLYQQQVTLTGFTGYGINRVGEYSYVCVFEIDRQQELTAPITARRMLTLARTLQQAASSPGSYFIDITSNINPLNVIIHPSHNGSPNNHDRYRYEVTVRDRAINSSYYPGNVFEHLWVRGYGAGNGMIPVGENSIFNRTILGPGAGIHHLVLRGGSINNTLFLPAPDNVTSFAVVFYDTEGFGRHNSIRNSIFLDIPDPVYTHNSYGSNFGALELNNVFSFAKPGKAAAFIGTRNTDSVLLNEVHCYNHTYGYLYGWAKYVSVKNSVFAEVNTGMAFSSFKTQAAVHNSFIKTAGKDMLVKGIELGDSTSLFLSNSIIQLTNAKGMVSSLPDAGYFLPNTGAGKNHISSNGNIFICDVDSSKYTTMAASVVNAGVSTDSWSGNVYLLLSGKGFRWVVKNTGGYKVVGFEEWKQLTGQDKNSILIDLRQDARGLSAVFNNPSAGDYELANTIEGRQVKALKAGMTKPIACFTARPSYEEAAAIISNNGVLKSGACRSPCVQAGIRGGSALAIQQTGTKKVQVQWRLDDERGVLRYELLKSYGSYDYTSIAAITPSGDSVYQFTDEEVLPGVEYRYSIKVVAVQGNNCFSAASNINITALKTVGAYPNPTTGKLQLLLNGYEGKIGLTLTDMSGRQVLVKQWQAVYGAANQLNLSALPKGIYWLRLQTGSNSSIQRIVLQ
jgi:hypothetical protein